MEVIGIDYGSKWIGLSWGSQELNIAVPLTAFRFHSFPAFLQHLQQVIRERNCEAIILGLPLNMDGTQGRRVQEVKHFAEELKKSISLPVYFQDERLSTQTARSFLGTERLSLRKAKTQKNSGIIDSTAAVVIVEDWMERNLKKEY